MSGETERNVSGWTTDTLHAHVEAQLRDMRDLMDERLVASQRAIEVAFAAQQAAMSAALTAADKAVQAALLSAKEAVGKAEVATEKRIEGLNELRGIVNDISALQMPRSEAEQRINALDSSLDEMKDRLGRMEAGRQGGKDQLTSIYAFVAFLVTLMIIGTVLAANGVFGGK